MRKRILVVDDEPHIRKSLEFRLREVGYEVHLASSGQEALIVYEQTRASNPYDLIILDIIMPEMNGLEVLEKIRFDEKTRENPKNRTVPVLMLTALKGSWKEDAVKEGCNDFIVKPYDGEILLEAVKSKLS